MKEEIHDDYKLRLNRVFEYIDDHLQTRITLTQVAEVAYFSPYHFHRIFKKMTGETLNRYVKRRRTEKAALDLLHHRLDMTTIAHNYGFNDNPAFSKAFKKYYGISPSEFKKQNPNRYSKIRSLKSKNGQGYPDMDQYICIINNLKKWLKMNAKVEVKTLPAMKFMYITSLGSQHLSDCFYKLIGWAKSKGLMNSEARLMTMYHDSLKVTEEEKARMSACFIVSDRYDTEGEIEYKSIDAAKYIVGHFEICVDDFEQSWTAMFLWMNEHGYKKAEGDCFEIYHNNFNEHPDRIAVVDFCIPVL